MNTAFAATRLGDQTHDFAFDSDELSQSLKNLSIKTGISLIYDHRIVSGRKAPRLKGRHTSLEALEVLLFESNLEVREIDDSTMAIVDLATEKRVFERNAPEKISSEQERHDEIIVTASYRTPGPTTGARVFYSLDGADLQLTGAQNVAEPILDFPATVASVSSANTALLVSAGGLNLVDLRGLGAQRSLVLVNGRRFIRTSGGVGDIYGVDLNAIPTPFIERIEITNQGAGALLGTDAVAGVINIVMREDIEGVATSVHGGLSEHGDAREFSASILGGTTFKDDRGRIAAGFTYASDPSLLLDDRERLSSPPGFGLNGRVAPPPEGVFAPGFGGSSITPAGMVIGAITETGDTQVFFNYNDQIILSPDGQSFEQNERRLDQLFNWTQNFSALPEADRIHAYATAKYELTDEQQLYAEIFYSDSQINSQIAASPVTVFRGNNIATGDAIVVSADNPNTPPGLSDAISQLAGEPVSTFLINRRFIELGPRIRRINRENIQFVAGIAGQINNNWSYDVAYQFGRNKTDDIASGLAEASRVAIAIDPERCAAAPGCQPVNIFASNSITPAQSEFYLGGDRKRTFSTNEHIIRAGATGSLYSINGHKGVLAVGGEYRNTSLANRSASETSPESVLGEFSFPSARGDVTFTELFANTSLPITVEVPGAEILEISAGVRITHWSGGHLVSNISGDLSWSPAQGIELYANALRGGRTPNVVELFSSGADIGGLFFDPCSETSAEMVVTENCASGGPLGVSTGFKQTNLLTYMSFTGNPTLDAERIHSRLFGGALDVHALADLGDDALRISADWRYHRIKNAISATGGDEINACYESVGLSNSFCGVNPATGNLFIQRDPVTRQLTRVETTFLNGGFLEASGLDVNMKYNTALPRLPLAPALSIDFLYSYTHRVRMREAFDIESARLDGLADFPRHQIYATASLETGPFKTMWTVRKRGKAARFLDSDLPEATIPSVTYVDMGAHFRPHDGVIAYAGVENLFNTEFPSVAISEGGFLTQFYDIIGRRYFAGVKAEF